MNKKNVSYVFLLISTVILLLIVVDVYNERSQAHKISQTHVVLSSDCYICDRNNSCDNAGSGQTGGKSCDDGGGSCVLAGGPCEPGDDPIFK